MGKPEKVVLEIFSKLCNLSSLYGSYHPLSLKPYLSFVIFLPLSPITCSISFSLFSSLTHNSYITCQLVSFKIHKCVLKDIYGIRM